MTRQLPSAAMIAPSPSVWTPTCSLDDLPRGSLKTFKHAGAQLVLARTDTGEVYALDNRCPHEGYPLAQGDLKGCALTCCWHNWKFDVRSGACTLGGEDVRAFPVRVTAGVVEVDLAEPDPTTFFPAWCASLEQGLFQHDNGRAIRDGVRLVQGGYDPHLLLADIAAYDARHAEFGTTHALPVAADCGRLLGRYAGVDALYAIAPAIDMCGDANRRLAPRALAESLAGGTAESLRAAVEAEDGARAEGLLLGAFEAGLTRAEAERWLYGVLSDHFLDFGHPLIYLVKAQELLDRAGDDHARDIYVGLLQRIVNGTREDTLPYMAPYAKELERLAPDLARVHALARIDAPFDGWQLADAVLDGRNAGVALDALWEALSMGVPARRIAHALVAAGAERLLRFDDALDRSSEVAENWLWASHRFTHACAVRNAVERCEHPDALRFLFHAVMFQHSGRGMDLAPEQRFEAVEEGADAEDVLAAIVARDPRSAAARARGLVRSGAPLDELREQVEDLCIADPLVRPIVVAHAIKTSAAAFEELDNIFEPTARESVLACAVRLLASPLVERRVHSAVRTSIEWVVDGRVPRKLTQ